jgi:hypothetical protein
MKVINFKIVQTLLAVIFMFSVPFNISWLSYIMGFFLIIAIWIPTKKTDF